MWEWPRAIVEPLAHEAFDTAVASAPDDELETGRALLGRYFAWAPTVDHFTPVRVATDFEAEVPDPEDPARHLTATDGRPIRLRGRVELLVIDADDVYWIVTHRLTTAGFASVDLLRLDEQAVTACWAWEQCFLGMRIAGTIANELQTGPAEGAALDAGVPREVRADRRALATHRRLYAAPRRPPDREVTVVGDDGFRRTRIPRPREELDAMARQLASEVREMTDPTLAVYPHPTADNCDRCPYRAPCVTLMQGGDPTAELAAGFRRRGPELEEGRLGGSTWSMNRGAAPPRFGEGRDDR